MNFKLWLAALWLMVSSTALVAQQPAAAPAPIGANSIALLDIGHIFKNYEKFTTLTQALQKEVEAGDQQAQSFGRRIREAQEKLAGLKEGTPAFDQTEADMLRAQRELEQFRRTAQRDFLRKEADIYKTVYLEVEDAVGKYAEFYKFTLVLRFERQKIDEADDPRQILNGMNRHVIHYRQQDDITDPILAHLNETWRGRQSAGRFSP